MTTRIKRSLLFIVTMFIAFISFGCNINTILGASTQTTVTITGPTTVEVGDEITLSVVVGPQATISQEVTWEVTNPDVASITTDGVFKALDTGRVAVVATSVADVKASGKIYIKIVEKEIEYTDEAPTSISIIGNKKALSNEVGLYTFQTTPINASQAIIWSTSNSEIATVSNLGVVKFHQVGTVEIIATSAVDDAVFGKITVDVTDPVKNSDEEEAIISLIEETKNSVLGVANYQYNERNVLVKSSIGSGFVYDVWGYLKDGTITYNLEDSNVVNYGYFLITNRHVVEDCDALKIYLHTIDEEIPAELVQYDQKVDLAVVTFRYDEYIKPLKFANSDTLKAGQYCIAIGNPEGFEFSSSATLGIISHPLRYISDDTDGDGVNDWDAAYIQHDAAINPGNSGGPLFNIYGQVIGINTLKFATNDIDNMGFSIPSNDIIELLPYLEKGKVPVRARIGVTVIAIKDLLATDWENADYKYIIPEGVKTGIYVTEVVESSVAYGKIKADDIMLEFNGVVLKDSLQLRAELGAIVVGSNTEIQVKLLRNGQEITVTLIW